MQKLNLKARQEQVLVEGLGLVQSVLAAKAEASLVLVRRLAEEWG